MVQGRPVAGARQRPTHYYEHADQAEDQKCDQEGRRRVRSESPGNVSDFWCIWSNRAVRG